jgi:hypothetical protein
MATTPKVKPILRFFTCFCIIFLTAFAITTIVLYGETRRLAHRYPENERTPWRGPDDNTEDGDSMYYWPSAILYGADRLVLAAGIISLIIALSSLLSCFMSGSEIVCSLLGLVSLGTTMGALIHSMDWNTKYGQLAGDGAFYAVQSDIYQQYLSTFTLERWTCELKDFLVFQDEASDYTDMCKNSVGFVTRCCGVLGRLILE